MLQEAKMPRDVLIGMLAAAPDTTGKETFGTRLHADAIAGMAGSLLAADATVLDGVLSGTIESFVDPKVPFAVPSLVICADPASPDAVADPEPRPSVRRPVGRRRRYSSSMERAT